MGLALGDDRDHTCADYLAWPEGVRDALIDGTACLTAPAPRLEHQEVVGEIYFQIRQALRQDAANCATAASAPLVSGPRNS